MPRGTINWIQVRTAYLVQGWSLAKCAEHFHVNLTTVKKRASEEGWHAERNRNATNATAVASDAAIQAVAESRAKFQEGLNKQLFGLFALLVDGQADIEAAKPGRSRAETRKAVIEAYALVAKTGRENMGLQPGQSTFTDADDDGRKRVIFVGVEDGTEETA